MNKWVLLDDDNKPVRYFDYPAKGAVLIKIKKLTMDEMIEQLGECLP